MKKVNLDKWIVAFLIVLLVILLFYLVKDYFFINEGDSVLVDYTLYVDGMVYETTIIEDAKEAGIFDENKGYKPLNFVIGRGSVLKKFEETVKRMKEGEEDVIELSAVEGYGGVDENKLLKGLRREVIINKTSMIDLNSFKELFAREPVINDFVTDINFPWDIKIVAVDGNIVTVENILSKGEKIVLPGSEWDSVVEGVDETTITIRQYPEVGDNLVIPGEFLLRAKVFNVDDETFDVDLNHPLAGKSLRFKIILVDVKKD